MATALFRARAQYLRPALFRGTIGPSSRLEISACRKMCNKKSAHEKISIYITAPAGALAGCLGALCGVGGGLITMPIMKHFTKMTTHQITATSLFSITIASSVGAAAYISQGIADMHAASMMSVAGLMTASIGAKVNHLLPASSLSKLLAVVMLLSVPVVLSKESRKTRDHDEVATLPSRTQQVSLQSIGNYVSSPSNWHFAGVGAVVGFASALLGVGGGIIMTTYMSSVTDMSQHAAVATSLVAMVPSGLMATFWHMRAGHVHARAAIAIGTSCAVGMYLTAQFLAPTCSEETMRKIFAALLLGSSVRMLL